MVIPVPAVTVVVAAIVPGAINVDGVDRVTVAELSPVVVIWFVVPAIVTVAPVAVPESPSRVAIPPAPGDWKLGAPPTFTVRTYPALATSFTTPTTLVADATKTSPRATVLGNVNVDQIGSDVVTPLRYLPVVPTANDVNVPATFPTWTV